MRGVVGSLSKSLALFGALNVFASPAISEQDRYVPDTLSYNIEYRSNPNPLNLFLREDREEGFNAENSLFQGMGMDVSPIVRLSNGVTIWEDETSEAKITPRAGASYFRSYQGSQSFLRTEYSLCMSLEKRDSIIETCMGRQRNLPEHLERLFDDRKGFISLRFSYEF